MKKIVLAAAATVTALTLSAEGYQINTLSAKQGGMGHTGVAQKLGAESMFFNPAGVAFMDSLMDISASITGIKAIADAKVKNPDGTTSSYSTHNGMSTPIAAGAAFRIYDKLKAGIMFYTPYGSAINWTDNWPGAVLNQSVDLKTYSIQPTFSYKILDNLSIGAGLMLTWGSVDLNKGLVPASSMDAMLDQMQIPGYRFGQTTPASVNLNGTTSLALGFNVGVMWDISSKVTVGASYRSRMDMKVDAGDASISYANELAQQLLQSRLDVLNQANFKAQMPCPEVWLAGVSYRPLEGLTLALDVQLTGWRAYKNLDIEFLDPHLTPYDQHLKKDYKDAWTFHVGAQYALTSRFDIRAGLMVDTTPVNSDYYNPETPGATKIEPSAGFSFRPVKNFSIDFSFMYVAGLKRSDTKCPYTDLLLGTERTFNADYTVKAFCPSFGLSYRF